MARENRHLEVATHARPSIGVNPPVRVGSSRERSLLRWRLLQRFNRRRCSRNRACRGDGNAPLPDAYQSRSSGAHQRRQSACRGGLGQRCDRDELPGRRVGSEWPALSPITAGLGHVLQRHVDIARRPRVHQWRQPPVPIHFSASRATPCSTPPPASSPTWRIWPTAAGIRR